MADNIVDIALKLSVDDSEVAKSLEEISKNTKQAFGKEAGVVNKQFQALEDRVKSIKIAAEAVNEAMRKADTSRGKTKSHGTIVDVQDNITAIDMITAKVADLYQQIQNLERKQVNIDFPKEQEENLDARLKNEERLEEIESRRLAINKELKNISSRISKDNETLKQMNEGLYTGKKTEGELQERVQSFRESADALKEERSAIAEEAQQIAAENAELSKRAQLLDKLESDENLRNSYAQKGINTQIELQEQIEAESAKVEDINNATGEIVEKSGMLKNIHEDITDSVKKTSGAIKETLTIEQQSAKESLKNARNKASANYYVLRSLKMTIKEVDNLTKKIRALEATLLKTSQNGLKGLLKLGLGFANLRKHLNHTSKSHNGFVGSMKIGFRTILKYTFGIRSFYFLLNKLRKALGDSMGVLAMSSNHVNEQMSSLLSNVSWMKNMMATAAQPLLNILVPAMDIVANAFDRATRAIASFFATLTGQSFIYKAIKPTEDYAAALDKTGKNAKKAKDNVQSFDELHIISDNGSGGDSGAGQFETAEVETAASELAKKVKDIFATLFDPIKKAWDDKGKFVMDSWKYAVKEVGELIAQVGKDFLTVWSNDVGVNIWKNILQIVGDVGEIVGNIASRFREAWVEADKGLHILEGIQMLVDIIIQGIRNMADATVEWSAKLDFNPLLQETLNLVNLLAVPVFHLTNILTDFWTNVVLPFRAYMIEDGLPKLLQVLQDIISAVDWQLLEERMNSLMESFEPFLETVWEGLLIVFDDLGKKLADFVNSDGFGYLIDKLKDFMDNASPEDVAKAIEKLAKDILVLHASLIALKGALSFVETIRTALNLYNQAKVLQNVKALNEAMGVESGLLGTLKKLPGNISTAIANMVEMGASADTLGSKISLLGQGIRQGFLDTFGSAGTLIAGIGMALGGVVVVLKNFVNMWKEGFHWINEIGVILGSVLVTIGLIVAGVAALPAVIVGAVIAAVTTIAVLVHDHWEQIKAVFSGIATWFNENVVQPVLNFLKPVTDWLSALLQTVSDVFESIKIIIHAAVMVVWQAIAVKVDEVKRRFNELFDGIHKAASGVWNKIKPVLMKIANFVYVKVIKPVSEFFGDLWDGITTGVKTALNTAIGIIEKFVNFVIDAINVFLGGLEDLASVASKITGEDYSGIATIKHVNLPRLAQGAVIPPNKEFLAVLGDQKSGTNIEAPLTTIQDAVALVLQPYLERLISITEDIYEKEMDVNIGDEEIARASVRGQRKLGVNILS